MLKRRVLIVDDSPVMRQLIRSLLERDPLFEVAGTASNGSDALELIVALSPDLVIMDVEMPIMDGLQALRHMTDLYPIPVVMLSSYTDEGSPSSHDAIRGGAADFFHKDLLFNHPLQPAHVEEFLMRCREALHFNASDPVRFLARWDEMHRTFRVLITHLAEGFQSGTSSLPSLQRTITQLNGLLFVVERRGDEFYTTFSEGQLLTRFGVSESSIVGADRKMYLPPLAYDYFTNHYLQTCRSKEPRNFEYEWKNTKVHGMLQPRLQDGEVAQICGVLVDVTEAKRMRDQIAFWTTHDSLTGLLNRRRALEIIASRIEKGEPFAILAIHLDHFKLANDTYGHHTGDLILQLIARRLRQFKERAVAIFRNGNGDFAIVARDSACAAVTALGNDVLRAIRQPLPVGGHDIRLTASIGLVRFPEDQSDSETLLQSAHLAMDQAKQSGGDVICFFERAFHDNVLRRAAIERNLRGAVGRQELLLHYQPQIDAGTNELVGMECLIRWDCPELGRVSPLAFIPVAEETGLIYEIGDWALAEACAQNKRWQDAGLPRVPIAVNLSARQFHDPNLKERVEALLGESGLDPRYLVLEITESMTMHVHESLAILRNLKSLGLSIAIDDFGTGYSSLSYLREFPVDKLKIDQSFVKVMQDAPANAQIVKMIIGLSQSLDLSVIAEGVETPEQRDLLLGLGCSVMQGYWFSRPLDAERTAAFLAERRGGEVTA